MVEYVGLDVSKEATAYCIKDEDGKVFARGKVASDPDALFKVLKEHCLCPERIVLETGTLSNWLGRELGKKLGISAPDLAGPTSILFEQTLKLSGIVVTHFNTLRLSGC